MISDKTKAALQSVSAAAARSEKMNHPAQAKELSDAHSHLETVIQLLDERRLAAVEAAKRPTKAPHTDAAAFIVIVALCTFFVWYDYYTQSSSLRNDWVLVVVTGVTIVFLALGLIRQSSTK